MTIAFLLLNAAEAPLDAHMIHARLAHLEARHDQIKPQVEATLHKQNLRQVNKMLEGKLQCTPSGNIEVPLYLMHFVFVQYALNDARKLMQVQPYQNNATIQEQYKQAMRFVTIGEGYCASIKEWLDAISSQHG